MINASEEQHKMFDHLSTLIVAYGDAFPKKEGAWYRLRLPPSDEFLQLNTLTMEIKLKSGSGEYEKEFDRGLITGFTGKDILLVGKGGAWAHQMTGRHIAIDNAKLAGLVSRVEMVSKDRMTREEAEQYVNGRFRRSIVDAMSPSPESTVSNDRRALEEAEKYINAMGLMLARQGHRAKSPDEESLVGYFLKAHRVIAAAVNEERTAQQLIRGVEKLLVDQRPELSKRSLL